MPSTQWVRRRHECAAMVLEGFKWRCRAPSRRVRRVNVDARSMQGYLQPYVAWFLRF